VTPEKALWKMSVKKSHPEERKTYYRRLSGILQAVVVELLREERVRVGRSDKFCLYFFLTGKKFPLT
jgi:hypothetical protein